MSLRQLAAEVGIQQGSLYNYFRNKQEMKTCCGRSTW
jgi:AcrR family transcriptional regulator